ncbi:ATP-dependent RNA helicase HrpA [Candidatus Sororendozoicomonas aggregata]|uniref:ATP-dependent RNA helicase HrpA n=1 Tax=Candidatus Sororendozoicomonas aggregata TaxID=3073239 RepID=UPI002ED64C38
MPSPVINQLRQHLPSCMIKDQYRFRNQLRRLSYDNHKGLENIQASIAASQAQARRRSAAVPEITYDKELPVASRKETIINTLRDNQVVIIAGETGSGKTTQLPKMCLDMGRGVLGLIGHTQPRRLAARQVAARIAEELDVPVGEQVGYQVRFNDHVSDKTLVKLMTDGILLAEIQNDRFLRRYDTLIIDEAHERSLNIDFLLGFLKLLLPKRPDLKVIITSATIDVERFSRHFNGAPVLEVSGRTYPVTVHYRPLEGLNLESRDADQRLQQGILSALQEIFELERSGKSTRLGDVLVFLSGERDIRETARFLRDARLPHTDILPLYARLTAAEQNKVFQIHAGRRVILSTNVAETSLTVPGIRYVIDPGMARISRYSVRSKVQRLPVEPVSQASANQRKGRCGRVAAGICFRLYAEEDFLGRPEFTDAEIRRTNLAAVILQMLGMGLTDIARFPFVDKPEDKAINDGFKLLQELGAVNNKRGLTTIGRQLGKLPVDPRFGRMLIEGAKNNALSELLIIISALTIQDPRERPADKQQRADQCHREYYHEDSDFLTFVNLWQSYEEHRQALSQNQLRKHCKKQFLSFIRMREWRDLHRQLTLACRDLSFQCNEEPASYGDVHRSLLTGLLSHLGNKDDEADYLGARNRRFYLFPASTLHKRKPKWVMTAELVETSRLFGRVNAKIDPRWIEPLAQDLVKRNYFEPHWEKKRAQVVAFEQVTLYGLIITGRRRVNFDAIDPVVAREIFIREALVAGEYTSKGLFFSHNKKLIEEVEKLEDKTRRRDILVESERLYAFYDERIPAEITNGPGFERWRVTIERDKPHWLWLTRDYLIRHDAGQVAEAKYPDCFRWEGLKLPLTYHFEPGHEHDGVTLTVPVQALRLLPLYRLQWLVPGMLFEKCVAMVRALPKALRKNFVPVPDFVRGALDSVSACDIPLVEVLGKQLTRMSGVPVPDDAWDVDRIDAHYRMNIRVVDASGDTLAQGRDLVALKTRFGQLAEESLHSEDSDPLEQTGLKDWTCGELPLEMTRDYAGLTLKVYPALLDQGDSVAVKLFDNEALAACEHRAGLIRLLRFRLVNPLKIALSNMKLLKQTQLLATNLFSHKALEDDLSSFLVAETFLAESVRPDSKAAFDTLIERYQDGLTPLAEKVDPLLNTLFKTAQSISRQLKAKNIPFDRAFSLSDIKQHLSLLIHKGFLQQSGMKWLVHYPRYLKAIEMRLDKLPGKVNQDRAWAEELNTLYTGYARRLDAHKTHKIFDKNLTHYRWMLEEYRVSLFAQQLGTHFPVSDKRLRKLWADVVEV